MSSGLWRRVEGKEFQEQKAWSTCCFLLKVGMRKVLSSEEERAKFTVGCPVCWRSSAESMWLNNAGWECGVCSGFTTNVVHTKQDCIHHSLHTVVHTRFSNTHHSYCIQGKGYLPLCTYSRTYTVRFYPPLSIYSCPHKVQWYPPLLSYTRQVYIISHYVRTLVHTS